MMSEPRLENLEIAASTGTYFIPNVNFNAETGVCLLEGESYHENTWEFYNSLMHWLNRYMQEVGGELRFNFRLTYFNTSSSKCLLDIMRLLKDYQAQGKPVYAHWYYPEDDVDNLAEAEDFVVDTGLDIEIIPY
jgi:SiaC family regulatory phosphoprotein